MPTDPTRLHEETGVFDAHADLLYTAVRRHRLGDRDVIVDQFLSGMRAGSIDMRVLPIYLDATESREPATRRGLAMGGVFHRELEGTDMFELATTGEDVRKGATSDEITLILGMEGVEALKGDRIILETFYRLGLRVLGLTHSRRNLAADGAFFQPTRAGEPGGLSDFGVDLVDKCEDLGIVLDVSHINEQGFWDVVEYAHKPFIASHSNCRGLFDHPRNLWDDQIRAIADAEGVIGVNVLRAFLSEEAPDIGTVVDNIEHIVDIAGIDHVGLGFDFYDYNLEYMSPAEREYMIDVDTAEGIESDADVGSLTPALLDRGFEPEEIQQILKGNFVRVFETVLPGGGC